jgi:prepilin-type processing-associated H-X9-DG protein
LSSQREGRSTMQNLGYFRFRDLIAVLAIAGFAAGLLMPALVITREHARRRQCVENLRRIGSALHGYHTAQQVLPPAAIWNAGRVRTLMLQEVKRIDLITHENWAQLILPFCGRSDVADAFAKGSPVMARLNEKARLAAVPEFICPTDSFNWADDRYAFQPEGSDQPLAQFARGNYAINGGTHSLKFTAEGTLQPHGDGLQLVIDERRRSFKMAGNGIAGINEAFRIERFKNGQSSLVAVEEIRAGIHPFDLRGVWALGQIGSSITWGHGVAGDDSGPNNQSEKADDILGCGRLHALLGAERLRALGMPCVSYVDRSQEATARSLHAGGVNVLFLDGAVRFVCDGVDRGLWHVMHSRETPADELDCFEPALVPDGPPPEAVAARYGHNSEPQPGAIFTNSANMHFTAIPGGIFTMGVPDQGNDDALPPECPAHQVCITNNYWLGAHEVSQRQFEAIMGETPSHHKSSTAGVEWTEDFPVEQVSWYQAVDFCRRLSERPQEQVERRRYRLPTEAEWEYACRAGASEPYPWTPVRQANDHSGAAAGIEPALPITKVGSYPANAFGLYDMRGNVWEWCADWFDRSYYSRSPRDNPLGPARGYLKVVRGSDWIFVGERCRINYPMMPPWKNSPFVGFRVVCEVERPKSAKRQLANVN